MTTTDTAMPQEHPKTAMPRSVVSAVEALSSVSRGSRQKTWVNLDGLKLDRASIRALDVAMRTSSVETLSLRYCDLEMDALAKLIGGNTSLEMVYLHFSVGKDSQLISDAWHRHGHFHRVLTTGINTMTLFRKKSLAYLAHRDRDVPAWANTIVKPKAKAKAKKSKKKSKKK